MVITFDYLAASLKQRSPWNCEIWVILKLRIGQSYSKNDGGHDLHLCLDFLCYAFERVNTSKMTGKMGEKKREVMCKY